MSSENDLRCNNLECRAQLGLEGKAVVTGCSRKLKVRGIASTDYDEISSVVRSWSAVGTAAKCISYQFPAPTTFLPHLRIVQPAIKSCLTRKLRLQATMDTLNSTAMTLWWAEKLVSIVTPAKHP